MSDDGLITAGQLLGKRERRYTTVEIAGLGLCRLQSITERERLEWELGQYTPKGAYDPKRVPLQRTGLIALCLVDAGGLKILSRADADALADHCDAAVIDALFDACKRHANMEDEAAKKKLPD